MTAAAPEAADDQSARDAALDVSSSFLIQAPAGSGKTELLIQRYLALLAHVDRPERIVAITFTRKAAAEMRERVIAALRDAADAGPAVDPHAQRTRALASAVLAQDAIAQWRILEHPARLAISTIDSLAALVARQRPLATGLGASARAEKRAQTLYADAARATLAAARSNDRAWRELLAHLANDAARAVELVAAMLAKREQWLPFVVGADPAALRAALERTLRAEVDAELRVLRTLMPSGSAGRMAPLAAYAAKHLGADSPWATALQKLGASGQWPAGDASTAHAWQALAQWLLRREDAAFVVQVDTRRGFPAKGKGPGALLREERKREMHAALADFTAVHGLAKALHVGRQLPAFDYDDASWVVVSALLEILPLAAAQLRVVFAETKEEDFTEGTLSAIDALGPADAPSDLLLRFDMAISHLLIDEYQDTSALQNAFLARLMTGWVQGDGRTVFAVGDPMQSIYRFRGAEVRLFIAAQADREVCGVPVETLRLARNFRSQENVVAWVNQVFPRVLPAASDPWRSVVGFAPSTPTRGPVAQVSPVLQIADSHEAEAALVVRCVADALAEPTGDVAILVRARTHLAAILPALRAAGVAYAAVELDALGDRQVTKDLAALTHALIQPADRLAWQSVLRAPWCGILLPDLVLLAQRNDDGLAGACRAAPALAGLSDDARERIGRMAEIFLPILAARGVTSLRDRVQAAWLALGGPALATDPIDREAARQFFELLAQDEYAGDVRDWNRFCADLDALHAQPEVDPAVRVQVMTLHRAKGLEFDTVILPGLARSPRRTTRELLFWRARPHGIMLAPVDATGAEPSRLHNYLGLLAADEADAELGRLLYVSVTRAKTRLHLTASLSPRVSKSGALAWTNPQASSALHALWPALGPRVAPPATLSGARPVAQARPAHFVRVPGAWRPDLPKSPRLQAPAARVPRPLAPAFDWANATAAAVGTVAHRLLHGIARDGLAAWTQARIAAQRPRVSVELAAEGVLPADRARAAATTLDVIARTLADERGRWLFDPAHAEAGSERALAGVDRGELVHVTLDRTFVADGKRWIVDFKTGRHEGGDIGAFLDRERERYREQLERYARMVRSIDPRPIELALYYPLVQGGWRQWSFTDQP